MGGRPNVNARVDDATAAAMAQVAAMPIADLYAKVGLDGLGTLSGTPDDSGCGENVT